jgi:hypothetical protein
MIREPCFVCGEETAPGSPLYSSRTVVARDGTRGFVCVDCRARASPERRHELTREQLARLNESAAVFGAWWSGGPGGGFPG